MMMPLLMVVVMMKTDKNIDHVMNISLNIYAYTTFYTRPTYWERCNYFPSSVFIVMFHNLNICF